MSRKKVKSGKLYFHLRIIAISPHSFTAALHMPLSYCDISRSSITLIHPPANSDSVHLRSSGAAGVSHCVCQSVVCTPEPIFPLGRLVLRQNISAFANLEGYQSASEHRTPNISLSVFKNRWTSAKVSVVSIWLITSGRVTNV